MHAANAVSQFTINVFDATPPDIFNCPADIVVDANSEIDAPGGAVVDWAIPTASDNVDSSQDLEYFTSVAPGSVFVILDVPTVVTISFTDTRGNSAFCRFQVRFTYVPFL